MGFDDGNFLIDLNVDYGPYGPAEFLELKRIYNEQFGLVLASHHLHAIHKPLMEQVRENGYDRLEAYLKSLNAKSKTEEALSVFIPSLTVKESYFFRFLEQLQLLPNLIVDALAQKKGEDLTIWTAGCSTGEECYTLAMILYDALRLNDFDRIRIVASDINHDALAFAQQARYNYWSFRNTPDEMMDRFFRHVEGTFEVRKFITEKVRFVKSNLNRPEKWPFTDNEVRFIFCRNVMIYFDKNSTRRTLENFHRVLDPDGCLFLGHSESTWEADNLFKVVLQPGAFFYRPAESQAATPKPVETPLPRPNPVERKPAETAPPPPEADKTKQDPEHWNRLLNSATLLANRGRLHDAARGFFECLLAEETATMGNLGLAYIDIQRGKLAEAETRLNEILKADDLAAVGYYLRGLLKEAKNDRDSAIEDFKKALYLDSGLALAHVHLATLLESRSSKEEALRAYRACEKTLHSASQTDPFWGDASRESLLDYALARIAALSK